MINTKSTTYILATSFFFLIFKRLLLGSGVAWSATQWTHTFQISKNFSRGNTYVWEQGLLVLSSLLLSPVFITFGHMHVGMHMCVRVCMCVCVCTFLADYTFHCYS